MRVITMVDNEITLIDAKLIEGCKCERITNEEVPEMVELAKKMIEYCYKNGGVGLSAPQIGVYKRMFVYRKTEDSFQVIINPEYIELSKKKMKVLESCMSYPNENFLVSRSREIQAIYYEYDKKKKELVRKGRELNGNKSIIFQHETLHLDGHTIKTDGVPQING